MTGEITAAIIKVDCLYGVKALRPRWMMGGEGWTDWREVYSGPTAPPTCGYCGHPPGDGRNKCLNCGAPK